MSRLSSTCLHKNIQYMFLQLLFSFNSRWGHPAMKCLPRIVKVKNFYQKREHISSEAQHLLTKFKLIFPFSLDNSILNCCMGTKDYILSYFCSLSAGQCKSWSVLYLGHIFNMPFLKKEKKIRPKTSKPKPSHHPGVYPQSFLIGATHHIFKKMESSDIHYFVICLLAPLITFTQFYSIQQSLMTKEVPICLYSKVWWATTPHQQSFSVHVGNLLQGSPVAGSCWQCRSRIPPTRRSSPTTPCSFQVMSSGQHSPNSGVPFPKKTCSLHPPSFPIRLQGLSWEGRMSLQPALSCPSSMGALPFSSWPSQHQADG